ncbi:MULTISPECIES: fimbrial protein [Proteus]|uniref:Fimbrial adhesin n=2 Tax=Proteus vulgaris TaxID=585 RepID=A0A379FB46_PROVU|nr:MULTISPECIES: fimbrial protein [Proteus]NBN58585.1 fimbrial protein [Proteus sp. G2639]RNT31756.1 fimbrial protein [Proteus mirabilis]KGA55704.1 fimbrial family protein [Proteus vulgaris]MBG5972461.1 fimbrial protein [Proteus vulgaris]MBG5985994.1 fimbrial protein [Proteus vulgaris]
MGNIIIKPLLLSGVLIYSTYSTAACIQNPNYKNIIVNVPNRVFNIQYDDLTTRTLDTIKLSYLPPYTASYEGDNGLCGNAIITGRFINGWTPNSNKIAATNIPGIGIRVKMTNIGHINTSFVKDNERQKYIINNPTWVVEIIKTGRVTQSNTLMGGNLARMEQNNTLPNTSRWILSTLRIPIGSIKVNSLKCTTKSNNYNINLGTWYDTQFKNIGDVSQNVNIPITLSCAAGTNIKATVTSSAGYIDANTGKLNLSGSNRATGIGIQIVNSNNTPIKLNTKLNLQNNVSSGDYIFNWKARYIKTSNKITAGTANSVATVNILYE